MLSSYDHSRKMLSSKGFGQTQTRYAKLAVNPRSLSAPIAARRNFAASRHEQVVATPQRMVQHHQHLHCNREEMVEEQDPEYSFLQRRTPPAQDSEEFELPADDVPMSQLSQLTDECSTITSHSSHSSVFHRDPSMTPKTQHHQPLSNTNHSSRTGTRTSRFAHLMASNKRVQTFGTNPVAPTPTSVTHGVARGITQTPSYQRKSKSKIKNQSGWTPNSTTPATTATVHNTTNRISTTSSIMTTPMRVSDHSDDVTRSGFVSNVPTPKAAPTPTAQSGSQLSSSVSVASNSTNTNHLTKLHQLQYENMMKQQLLKLEQKGEELSAMLTQAKQNAEADIALKQTSSTEALEHRAEQIANEHQERLTQGFEKHQVSLIDSCIPVLKEKISALVTPWVTRFQGMVSCITSSNHATHTAGDATQPKLLTNSTSEDLTIEKKRSSPTKDQVSRKKHKRATSITATPPAAKSPVTRKEMTPRTQSPLSTSTTMSPTTTSIQEVHDTTSRTPTVPIKLSTKKKSPAACQHISVKIISSASRTKKRPAVITLSFLSTSNTLSPTITTPIKSVHRTANRTLTLPDVETADLSDEDVQTPKPVAVKKKSSPTKFSTKEKSETPAARQKISNPVTSSTDEAKKIQAVITQSPLSTSSTLSSTTTTTIQEFHRSVSRTLTLPDWHGDTAELSDEDVQTPKPVCVAVKKKPGPTKFFAKEKSETPAACPKIDPVTSSTDEAKKLQAVITQSPLSTSSTLSSTTTTTIQEFHRSVNRTPALPDWHTETAELSDEDMQTPKPVAIKKKSGPIKLPAKRKSETPAACPKIDPVTSSTNKKRQVVIDIDGEADDEYVRVFQPAQSSKRKKSYGRPPFAQITASSNTPTSSASKMKEKRIAKTKKTTKKSVASKVGRKALFRGAPKINRCPRKSVLGQLRKTKMKKKSISTMMVGDADDSVFDFRF